MAEFKIEISRFEMRRNGLSPDEMIFSTKLWDSLKQIVIFRLKRITAAQLCENSFVSAYQDNEKCKKNRCKRFFSTSWNITHSLPVFHLQTLDEILHYYKNSSTCVLIIPLVALNPKCKTRRSIAIEKSIDQFAIKHCKARDSTRKRWKSRRDCEYFDSINERIENLPYWNCNFRNIPEWLDDRTGVYSRPDRNVKKLATQRRIQVTRGNVTLSSTQFHRELVASRNCCCSRAQSNFNTRAISRGSIGRDLITKGSRLSARNLMNIWYTRSYFAHLQRNSLETFSSLIMRYCLTTRTTRQR